MKILKKSILISLTLFLICGLIYPLTMTGVSAIVMNKKANGSIINVNGKKVGSEFIGQDFTDKRFLKGRISNVKYNTFTKDNFKNDIASGSENLAPSNKLLKERVEKDLDEFIKNNPNVKKEDIPTDLLTSSASGLDPHISPEAAYIQILSISKESGIKEEELKSIIDSCTLDKNFKVFGERRVNVLKVNLEIAKKLNII